MPLMSCVARVPARASSRAAGEDWGCGDGDGVGRRRDLGEGVECTSESALPCEGKIRGRLGQNMGSCVEGVVGLVESECS